MNSTINGENLHFHHNKAEYGAGFYIYSSSTFYARNITVYKNSAGVRAGAFYNYGSHLEMINSTVVNNYTSDFYASIYMQTGAYHEIVCQIIHV